MSDGALKDDDEDVFLSDEGVLLSVERIGESTSERERVRGVGVSGVHGMQADSLPRLGVSGVASIGEFVAASIGICGVVSVEVFVIAFIGVLGVAFVRRLRSGGGGGLQRSVDVGVDGSSSMIVGRPCPLREDRRPLRVASACSRNLRNLCLSDKRSSTSGDMSCSTRGALRCCGVYNAWIGAYRVGVYCTGVYGPSTGVIGPSASANEHLTGVDGYDIDDGSVVIADGNEAAIIF